MCCPAWPIQFHAIQLDWWYYRVCFFRYKKLNGKLILGSMSLNTSSTNPLRGGSIQIDGINILVPTNLLPTLPALTVAWQELFDAQNNGLAVGFEANVGYALCYSVDEERLTNIRS